MIQAFISVSITMFKTIAGDFLNDQKIHTFFEGYFYMHSPNAGGESIGKALLQGLFGKKPKAEKIYITEVEELETASEENVKRIGGTVGWGVAGAALLGPVGLLAGLLLGGKGKEVVIVCKLKDGRKFLAVVDSGTYQKIQAAMF